MAILERGGVVVGPPHSEGGVPFIIQDTGRHIEEEGGEINIPAEIVNNSKKYEFTGTNAEILNEILKLGNISLNDKVTTIKSGDIVICVKSAWDNQIRTIKGTIPEILSAINTSKGCKLIEPGAEIETIAKEGGTMSKTKLLAPNGKPSNLAPEQYHLVRTPEFIKWFGDWMNSPETASKVVDENGEPLVVYHGTENIFYEFNKTHSREGLYGKGFYFTQYEKMASAYGEPISVFLSIKKPVKVTPKKTPDVLSKIISSDAKYLYGFDGVIVYDNKHNLQSITIFEPSQIKLADGTNTTFDSKNPDIRFTDGGIIPPHRKNESTCIAGNRFFVSEFYKGIKNGTIPYQIQKIETYNPFKHYIRIFDDVIEKYKDKEIDNTKPTGLHLLFNYKGENQIFPIDGNHRMFKLYKEGVKTTHIIIVQDVNAIKKYSDTLIDKNEIKPYREEKKEGGKISVAELIEFDNMQEEYGLVDDVRLQEGGEIPVKKEKKLSIKEKVLNAQDILKAMKTHTELRQWAISNGMDNRVAFPKFKLAIKEIGLDYDEIKTGIFQQQKKEFLEKIKYQTTLYVDAKASHDRFAITDEDGNVIWYGKFFDSDSDYDGEQSSAELAAAKKAVWLASKIKEAIGAEAIKLHLYVDAQWLTYQDHSGQKGYVLTQLSKRYGIDLNVIWISGTENPADKWTTESGYKKWSDNDLRTLAKTIEGKEIEIEKLPEIKQPVSIQKQKVVKINETYTEYEKSYGIDVYVVHSASDIAIKRKIFFPKSLVIEKGENYLIVPEWIFDKKIEEEKSSVNLPVWASRHIEINAEKIWMEKEKGQNLSKGGEISKSILTQEERILSDPYAKFERIYKDDPNLLKVIFSKPTILRIGKFRTKLVQAPPSHLWGRLMYEKKWGIEIYDPKEEKEYKTTIRESSNDKVFEFEITGSKIFESKSELKEFLRETDMNISPFAEVGKYIKQEGQNLSKGGDIPKSILTQETDLLGEEKTSTQLTFKQTLDNKLKWDREYRYYKEKGDLKKIKELESETKKEYIKDILGELSTQGYEVGNNIIGISGDNIALFEKVTGKRIKIFDVDAIEISKFIKDKYRDAKPISGYNAFIQLGHMTASDAKTIISSAGLEVPKDILEMAEKENGQNLSKGGDIQIEDPNSPRWQKKRESIMELSNNIHRLRSKVSYDLTSDDEKEFLTALIISLMDKTGERVGNGESARNGHYGITVLRKKHITILGDKIHLSYTGKSGVKHEKSFSDKRLAKALKKAIRKSPNRFIFSTSEGFIIRADKVNRYLDVFKITAKDFRGYNANKWIIEKLQSAEIPKEERERKRKFNAITRKIALKIGHGIGTLKKHYMIPELPEEYIIKGKIIDLKELGYYKEGGEIEKNIPIEEVELNGKLIGEYYEDDTSVKGISRVYEYNNVIYEILEEENTGKKSIQRLLEEKDFDRTKFSKNKEGGNIESDNEPLLLQTDGITDEKKKEAERMAEQFIENLSTDDLKSIKQQFESIKDNVIIEEEKNYDILQQKKNSLENERKDLYEKEKPLSFGKEKDELIEQRQKINQELDLIIKPSLIHQENKIKAIKNGGDLSSFTDKKFVAHNNIPYFVKIKTDLILFDEETILTDAIPPYIPLIDEDVFSGKGYIFDAIRIAPDKYLMAVNGYKEKRFSGYYRAGEFTGHPEDVEQGYVMVTLDQLALINDYYFTKAKAVLQKEADKSNLSREQSYDRMPREIRERHLSQKGFYNSVPASVKKKVTREEYEALSLEEKEKLYKPFKRHGIKRLTSRLEENQMWVSYHNMYERFINPEAVSPKRGYANPEVFDYWSNFREMMKWKIKDIKIQREVESETRKIALETSFGESNTDNILKEKYGILVKRQDGSKIMPNEIEQIRMAWEKINNTFGNLKDNAKNVNLKISHTGLKYVFASKSAGIFIPIMKTIAVSNKFGDNQFESIMAHETAHWIDYSIGQLKGKRHASDDFESTAGLIAGTLRENMNSRSDSDYVNSTAECFARAMEQYFAFENFGEEATLIFSYTPLDEVRTYHSEDKYVSKENFNNKIKPLIRKFLSENESWFNFGIGMKIAA